MISNFFFHETQVSGVFSLLCFEVCFWGLSKVLTEESKLLFTIFLRLLFPDFLDPEEKAEAFVHALIWK